MQLEHSLWKVDAIVVFGQLYLEALMFEGGKGRKIIDSSRKIKIVWSLYVYTHFIEFLVDALAMNGSGIGDTVRVRQINLVTVIEGVENAVWNRLMGDG